MKRSRLNTSNKIITAGSQTTLSIDYIEKEGVLEVEFVGNRVYHYYNVSHLTWEKYKNTVLTGGSSGEFVNNEIKPNYRFDAL